jgi:tetratricopeptide (TPR) repeat protein
MANRASELIARAEALYENALTPQSTRQIRQLLERGLAETWGLLANIIVCDYLNRWNDTGPAHLAEAQKAVRNALSLAPDIAIAHHAHGFIHRARGHHKAALDAFEKAVRHKPDFARAHAQRAAQLLYLGKCDAALQEIDKAIALSSAGPSLGMFQWIKGRAFFFKGDYAAAAVCLEDSVRLWPDLWYNRLYLVSAYAHLGKTDEAKAALREFDQRFPGYTLARVIEDEKTNPNSNRIVREGREKFHKGLRDAGMREK